MPIIFRFNLHNNWEVTIFVLNLAFAELLYCILNLPYLVYLHLNEKWDLGIQSCKISATLRYINLFANYMSVAMIATSRCVMVTKPKYFTNFLHKKNRLFILSCTWLYGLILVLPTNFEVSQVIAILSLLQFSPLQIIGQFGYNCIFTMCDYIPSSDQSLGPTTIMYDIGVIFPFILTLLSYSYIWLYSWNSHKYLKKHGTR